MNSMELHGIDGTNGGQALWVNEKKPMNKSFLMFQASGLGF